MTTERETPTCPTCGRTREQGAFWANYRYYCTDPWQRMSTHAERCVTCRDELAAAEQRADDAEGKVEALKFERAHYLEREAALRGALERIAIAMDPAHETITHDESLCNTCIARAALLLEQLASWNDAPYGVLSLVEAARHLRHRARGDQEDQP